MTSQLSGASQLAMPFHFHANEITCNKEEKKKKHY